MLSNRWFSSFSRLLLAKLVDECEKLAGRSVTSTRQIVNDVLFSVPLERAGDLIRFDVHAETLIASKRALPADSSSAAHQQVATLPNLFPLRHTISMAQQNIYKLTDHYRE